MMNKTTDKSCEKYDCLVTEFNLRNKGLQENTYYFFYWTLVSITKQREYLINLIYFSDGFRPITHADNKYGNTVEPPIRCDTK